MKDKRIQKDNLDSHSTVKTCSNILQNIELTLGNDMVELEIGYNIIPLVKQWLMNRNPDKLILVTDNTVHRLYKNKVFDVLATALPACILPISPGEKSKNIKTLEYLLERAVYEGVTKKTMVVSVGGGVVSNIAGMLAVLIFRGLQLVHIPTTIVAQIDASISRKQAVNGKYGKNLFGAWKAPEAIFVDFDFLATLDNRQIRTGLAEAIKLSLIGDLAMFRRFAAFKDTEWFRNMKIMEPILLRAIELTCAVLRLDPKESTEGMTFEIGHTIESIKEGKLTHGEAISIGMVIEARMSMLKGIATSTLPSQIEHTLKNINLPTQLPDDISTEQIIGTLQYDNKRVNNETSFIPVKNIGQINARGPDSRCILDNDLLKRATCGWADVKSVW